MKLLPALSAPMTVLLLGALATSVQAHPAPYAHHHVQTPPAAPVEVVVVKHRAKRVVKKVVYRPAPPTTIYVHEPAPVVETVVVTAAPPPVPLVVQTPAPTIVRARRAAAPRTFPGDSESVSIGLRGSGMAFEGTKLGLTADENMVLGGAGVMLHARFGHHFGIELTADVVGGSTDTVTQTSVPVMAALTYHFLPHSRFQPFLAAGAGVHFTQLDYLDGMYRHELVEAAAQLGAGVELFLTDDISLLGDVRGTAVFKNIDSQAKIRQDCISTVGSMSGFCDGLHGANPTDKVDIGVQFHLGANVHF